jgi:polyribonucleotide nucleotidyltransferase
MTTQGSKDFQGRFESEIGGKKLIIEIGKFAGLANGACTVRYGDTLVLATATIKKEPREGIDFLPLLVDYEEKLYAAGKIKGSRFIKRETRPSDEAILTSRLVDRAIRPFFDEKIRNDVQIVLTVLSFDGINDPDIPSLIAASTALAISDIPWQGPIAAVRVGQIRGEWVLNPSYEAREKSSLDLVIAGTYDQTVMLEGGALEVDEETFLKAIEFARKHIGRVLNLIKEIQEKIGREKNFELLESDEEKSEALQQIQEIVKKFLKENLDPALFNKTLEKKEDRKGAINQLKEALDKELEAQEIGKERRIKALGIFDKMIGEAVAQAILERNQRIDGRELDEIRPLNSEIGILPHTHGSGLFQRGQTQVLSIVTLGAPSEEQFLDTMETSGRKRFMHHYNFPGFSVGEVAPLRGPGRREIGHGALVEKALLPLIPDKEEFPYTIRVVSEVLSSNGSSSMASVCASSLALMDAGVPIKKPVAGIAMGLASKGKEKIEEYKIITDLQDLEDGPGGMDFKVAGTQDGITAIQMDTKTRGLSIQIIRETLEKAKKARIKILAEMNKTISSPREEVSEYAPKITMVKIDPAKIREVIGPGGRVINEIIGQTGVATIDIEPDGIVYITALNKESLSKAVDWVKNLTREIKVGEVFQGRVTRILDFGAFVEILPGQEGLVHISELAPWRVNRVEDVVKVGEVVPVKVVSIDEQGRINLSLKATQAFSRGPTSYSRRSSFRPGTR